MCKVKGTGHFFETFSESRCMALIIPIFIMNRFQAENRTNIPVLVSTISANIFGCNTKKGRIDS